MRYTARIRGLRLMERAGAASPVLVAKLSQGERLLHLIVFLQCVLQWCAGMSSWCLLSPRYVLSTIADANESCQDSTQYYRIPIL